MKSPEFFSLLDWSLPLGWSTGAGIGWEGGNAPWSGGTQTRELNAAGWTPGKCGPSPGSSDCRSPDAGEVAYWWDTREGAGGKKSWKRVIGIPETPKFCLTLWGCTHLELSEARNIEAQSAFVFNNPYAEVDIRFAERSSLHGGCVDTCSGTEVIVGPGESKVIPASPSGYYFAETLQSVSFESHGFLASDLPPPDGLLPAFFVTGGLE